MSDFVKHERDFMGVFLFTSRWGRGKVGRIDFAAGKNQRIRNRDALEAPVIGSIGSQRLLAPQARREPIQSHPTKGMKVGSLRVG
jgi:hypothetical protein